MSWKARARLLSERGTTLGALMERLAEVHGGRRLVEEAGGPVRTYEQAADRIARMAGGVTRLGAGGGDRVVLALPNSYDLALASMAVARAGGVAVPVNAELTRSEVDAVAADAGTRRIVRDAEELLGGDPVAAVDADMGEVAAILYTSGTTGRPKGARLTHRALVGQVASGVMWPAALRRDEVVMSLPLAHIMGFAAVIGTAVSGLPVYFIPRFSPVTVLDAIEQRRATLFIGVPAMYRMMLEAGADKRDLRSVRLWASGADAMPPDLARQFQRMGATATLPVVGDVGEAVFVEGYGMVETGGGVAFKLSPPGMSQLQVGSIGIPVPPNRMRVVREDGSTAAPGQVGELWVKGPGLLEGYHGDPEATSAVRTPDGWLRTGDMVRRGLFGLFQFAGRTKDVIKRGGYSVYAVEVQKAIEEHPGVAEAAVVGLPDARLGEVPAAAVRPAPGATLDPEELKAWSRDRLAEFKVPARFVIVDRLPRTDTRKVRRSEVRDLFS